MFLVTTANQNFWNSDEPILFLGEWCRIYSHKSTWSQLEHDVLPYHGQNRDTVYRDYKYAMDVYERILIELSKELNRLHGTNYSPRYWRIILGPWLLRFIEILLDRYRSICVASDSGEVTNTWITPEFPEEYLPNDFSEFRDWYCLDDYNHCLYSQVIKSLGTIPWEEKKDVDPLIFTPKEPTSSKSAGIKRTMIRWIKACSNFFPRILEPMVAVGTYIRPIDLMKLQLSMRMLPRPYDGVDVDVMPFKVDWEMRRDLELKQVENRFESILKEHIPFHIPKVYVEGYSTVAQKAMEAFPKKNKVILTSNAYMANEGFKFWAADQVSRGGKLAITQHGGHVGDGLWSTDDDHEFKIADRYFTWGWAREGESISVPLPSSMLRRGRGCKPNPNGAILCVAASFPRYPYVMLSSPTGPFGLDAFNEQNQFFNSVSPEVYKLLIQRLFPAGHRKTGGGLDEGKRWPDVQPSLRISRGAQTMYDQLNQSRLCVCFYNGTPFLETFVANYPTLLFWNPRYTELNELALPYFDLLRKAEILHDTPESAAFKLNEVYQRPLSWWRSPEVQDAKNNFCNMFARTSDEWVAQWKGELLKLACECQG